MDVTLLTIGDELLIGQVVNTNAAWLGEQLSAIGATVRRTDVLPDDHDVLAAAVRDAWQVSDVVVVTGGLGPTPDDVTREVLADVFGSRLSVHEPTLERIQDRFRNRRRAMPERNRRLALVPAGFDVLPNDLGTAPGLWVEREEEGRRRALVAVPGVPREMKAIFEDAVVPRLRSLGSLRVIAQRTLRTAGIGESNLQEKIGDLDGVLDASRRLAYLPSTSGVRLRLTVVSDDEHEARRRLVELDALIRERAGAYVYGTGDESLEEVVGRMLLDRDLALAVAESCTGGLVAHRLTNIPGSSRYVSGGVVAYANAVKIDVLGVDAQVLEQEGAVSEAVARQMARGVRERLGADVGIATTGVAGPGGGTPEKPVGTVWIAYADAAGETARLLHLVTDREMNKELTCMAVLDLVRRQLSARKA